MGTPGHIAHPFDVEAIETGQDLIDYIDTIVLRLQTGEIQGSVKWEGINTSIKLITTEEGNKEFRMDRGTSAIDSVVGFDAEMAFKKWGREHGMPKAIADVLAIFNSSLPSIALELKTLGLWEDSTKYLNMEYIKQQSNVLDYDKNILAIHGINQFYEKKAQPWRVDAGKSMDRPGLSRPLGLDGKPIQAKSIEIPYNQRALENLVEKVKPIASQYAFEVYGDVPVEFDPEIDLQLEKVLETPISIQIQPGNIETGTLREWLHMVRHPKDNEVTRRKDNKQIKALSKDVYLSVLNSAQRNGQAVSEYLVHEKEVEDAINGAIIYHATRLLGQEVKEALTSEVGNIGWHEGVVLRGMEDFLVKLTGHFIVQGLTSTHGTHPEATESLSEHFTIKVSEKREITKTLNHWLTEIKLSNHQYQKPPTFVYKDILAGIPIVEVVKQDFAQEMIYNTVLTYAAQLLVEEDIDIVDATTTWRPELDLEEPNELDIDIVDDEAPERESKTIAIVPGAFKPPHAGHADMVKRYATGKGVPKADKVYVIISAPQKASRTLRDGTPVSANDALDIWQQVFPEVASLPNVEFKVAPKEMRSPVTIAYEYIGERSPLEELQPGDNVILGASTKADKKEIPDWRRWDEAEKYVRSDLNLLAPEEHAVPPFGVEGKDLSASDLRDLISDLVENPGDRKARKTLANFIPKDKINTLLKILKLSDEEEEEPLDETSTAVGGVEGAPGMRGGSWRDMDVEKENEDEKQRSMLRRENKNISMVDEVMALIIQRGILR